MKKCINVELAKASAFGKIYVQLVRIFQEEILKNGCELLLNKMMRGLIVSLRVPDPSPITTYLTIEIVVSFMLISTEYPQRLKGYVAVNISMILKVRLTICSAY